MIICNVLQPVNLINNDRDVSETKRKIKTIAENGGGGDNLATSLNRRLLKWSQRTMQVRVYYITGKGGSDSP